MWLDAPPATLRTRLARRNLSPDANAAFPVTDALLDRFIQSFEPPCGEGEWRVVP